MGGGSSSSGWSSSSSKARIESLLQQASDDADSSVYNSEVNSLLQDALKKYNERNIAAINKHLEVLSKAIEKEIEDSVKLIFGGSVSKHTFVNGLSDIDTLVLINKTSLEKSSPQEILEYFARRIRERLPHISKENVSVGNMAVTVQYSDGCEVQILPAIRTSSGFRIADPEGKWSNVVRPKAFAQKLTTVNQEISEKVVPVIKLFKAAVKSNFPKSLKLSGYHAESLAIEAFNQYEGRRTYKDMLTHLCRSASERVKAPIKDKTGQSLHVDDYLGTENSEQRMKISSCLQRLATRMEKGDKLNSKEEWQRLFE